MKDEVLIRCESTLMDLHSLDHWAKPSHDSRVRLPGVKFVSSVLLRHLTSPKQKFRSGNFNDKTHSILKLFLTWNVIRIYWSNIGKTLRTVHMQWLSNARSQEWHSKRPSRASPSPSFCNGTWWDCSRVQVVSFSASFSSSFQECQSLTEGKLNSKSTSISCFHKAQHVTSKNFL